MSSKYRRALVAVAVSVAALLPLIVAPAGQAKRATCGRAHSKTVAKNRAVRVYTVKRSGATTLYGCRRSTGKRSKLGRKFNDVETAGTFRDVRLRGNYVAFVSSFTDDSCKAACPPGYQPTTTSIEVFNVRKHRSRTVDASPVGTALVLTDRGGVAWAGAGAEANFGLEIRGSVKSGDNRLFDSGNIDPTSLAIEITIISWTRDGDEHFARLR